MSRQLEQVSVIKHARIRLIGVLASAAGRRELELEITTGETVSSLIAKLLNLVGSGQFKDFLVDSGTGDPRPNVIILLDEQDCNLLGGLNAPVAANATVTIIPVAHGG